MGEIQRLNNEIADLKARIRELEQHQPKGQASQIIRSIAANSPSNIMLLNLDAQIQYISRTVPGITPEEMVGEVLTDIVEPAYRPGIRNALSRVVATGGHDRYETSYTSPSGDVSWWESSVGPVKDASVVTGFVVVSTNITEQRAQAEEQARFFNLSVDMMCVVGFDGVFKRLNLAFKSMLGDDSGITERPLFDFIHPDDIEATSEIVGRLIAGQNVEDFSNRYRAHDGTYRLLSWRGRGDLKRRVIYAVARDITNTKHLEEQLYQSRKMEAIGQLAGGVAHDFNNLLLVIQGNIELALEAPDTLPITLKEAVSASERAASLTRQLLTFSRHRAITPSAVALDSLLDNLMSLLTRLIPENITVQVQKTLKMPSVLADQTQLEQLVVNLCINARDAMPDGGRLCLTVEKLHIEKSEEVPTGPRAGEYVSLSVADTGCGMSESIQERVFEPFFTTKGVGKGTGLGLATVYGIVQQHHGFMKVESVLGQGSTFCVCLPATLDTEPPPLHQDCTTPINGGNETILLAEDSPMVRNVVVRLLSHAGYTVLSAQDGLEALEIYRLNEERISLVLLDVVMPNLGGLDTAKRLRLIHPKVKVAFASGHVQDFGDEQRLKGETLLPKPYRKDKLLREVRRLLDT